MFNLSCDDEIKHELEETVRLFFPDGDFSTSDMRQTYNASDQSLSVRIFVCDREFSFSRRLEHKDGEERKREIKRFNKRCLYDVLSEITGRKLPWGSLTGVRPTKLAYELIKEGKSIDEAVKTLSDYYRTSEDKAELVGRILREQRGIYRETEELVNLYIHIPFCPSRCSYCSFVTDILRPSYPYVRPYVDAVVKETEATKAVLRDSGKKILSVYIGGGTPTALDEDELKRVLEAAACGNVEFTCEAGRPDTLTEGKLKAMSDFGVTRVCINPQTLNDATLERIGRKHTVRAFFEAFELARKFSFDINTDLIAGLEGEGESELMRSLEGVAALRPENITLHTLARKNGSAVRLSDYRANAETDKAVETAHSFLSGAGYSPYYLYRQKRMIGNLENTGYTLPSKQCINNITTMEECVSVAAVGAGAISKRVFVGENRIERLASLRDVKLYLEQFEERLNKKSIFLS